MDKNDALKISRKYLRRVQKSNVGFTEAWLFGSYAKGNQHENSDIDIAIILNENVDHTFDTEVKLMVIRNADETLIEPHAFTKEEFDIRFPIVDQIMKHGEIIKI